jgi:hypothetical protein
MNTVQLLAMFTDLSINVAGIGYTLNSSSTGLTSAISNAFDISNPVPTISSISPSSTCARRK